MGSAARVGSSGGAGGAMAEGALRWERVRERERERKGRGLVTDKWSHVTMVNGMRIDPFSYLLHPSNQIHSIEWCYSKIRNGAIPFYCALHPNDI